MTANDSDVSDGETLTGSQVVRVYGQNLTAPFVTLTFGDVEYTPLIHGEGYIEFILGDNGTATISVDGSPFMSFEVEGVVVPNFLPNRLDMQQYINSSTQVDELVLDNVNCINYPFMKQEEAQFFQLRIGYASKVVQNLDAQDFSGENCSVTSVTNYGASRVEVRIRVTDATKVAYITYQGFIIAVFNYTTD